MKMVPEHIVRARSGERFVRERRVVKCADGRFGETILSRVRQHSIEFREDIDCQNSQVRLGPAVGIYRVEEGGVEALHKFAIHGQSVAAGSEQDRLVWKQVWELALIE